MYPALDLAGYRRRSDLPRKYIEDVETGTPGFVDTKIRLTQSRIYNQLRKRYGATLPFGSAPPFDVRGTAPPVVTLNGTPTLGSIELVVQITTAGALGTAAFQWSKDNGRTQSATGVLTAAAVPLTGTGLTAVFGVGSYSLDNLYIAPTPVVETVLGWIVAFVDYSVLRKHGLNANDAAHTFFVDEFTRAVSEVEKAANSKDGLFDLPAVDGQQPTAVSTGGIQAYSESGSPYVSADRQERDARFEDECGMGTFSGSGFFGGGP